MSSGTEGNTEGKQGGTDVEDDSSGILKVKWEELAARQMEKADWYRCGDGNDRTVPEEPGEF